MACFVTFEGIDGCGKTTQLGLLRAHLEAAGREVVATREPGGTALAESIRNYLLHTTGPLASETELLLFGAARAQHVAEVIRPALDRGAVVLSDRFTHSSVAYQGGGLGMDEEFIGAMNSFATAGLTPDMTFILDLDPETGWQRRSLQRGNAEDRIEERGLAFQRRVRAAFRRMAAAGPARIALLDASLPADAIHEQIVRKLESLGLS